MCGHLDDYRQQGRSGHNCIVFLLEQVCNISPSSCSHLFRVASNLRLPDGGQPFNNVTYNHLDNGGVSELRIAPIRPNLKWDRATVLPGPSNNDSANHHRGGSQDACTFQ